MADLPVSDERFLATKRQHCNHTSPAGVNAAWPHPMHQRVPSHRAHPCRAYPNPTFHVRHTWRHPQSEQQLASFTAAPRPVWPPKVLPVSAPARVHVDSGGGQQKGIVLQSNANKGSRCRQRAAAGAPSQQYKRPRRKSAGPADHVTPMQHTCLQHTMHAPKDMRTVHPSVTAWQHAPRTKTQLCARAHQHQGARTHTEHCSLAHCDSQQIAPHRLPSTQHQRKHNHSQTHVAHKSAYGNAPQGTPK